MLFIIGKINIFLFDLVHFFDCSDLHLFLLMWNYYLMYKIVMFIRFLVVLYRFKSVQLVLSRLTEVAPGNLK